MVHQSMDILQEDDLRTGKKQNKINQSIKLVASIKERDSFENFQDLPTCEIIEPQDFIPSTTSPRKVSNQIDSSEFALPSSKIKADMDKISQKSKYVFQNCREYDVPLPLTTHVRNIYTELLQKNRILLNIIAEDIPISSHLISRIDTLLDNLRRLCDHLGLRLDEFSNLKNESAVYQAKYAENISTKFIFIAELLHSIKSCKKHIIIVIGQRELINIFEEVFKTQEIVYCHADQQEPDIGSPESNEIKITLMPVTSEVYKVKPADILVAFDSSYLQLLHHTELTHSLTIVLRLVIYNSVEHLEKVVDGSMDKLTDKVNIIKHICAIANNVGTLPKEYPGPPDAAKLIAHYALQETRDSWPLLPLPKIDDVIENAQNLLTSSLLRIPEEYSEVNGNITSKTSAPLKRLSEVECVRTSFSAKRQKIELSSNESLTKNQILPTSTSLSDEIIEIHQEKDFKNEIKISYDMSCDLGCIPNDMSPKVFLSLQQKLNLLEMKLRKKEETEMELRQINQALERRCLDFESSLKVIQSRFLEALNDRSLFENEKKLAVCRESKMRQILEKKEVAFAKVQQEKAKVTEELKNAKKALLNSNIQEVVESEKMRLEISTLQDQNERLIKQKKIKQSEYDYMQTNYQTVSTSAASLNQQIKTQIGEIEALKLKANENAVEIQHIQRNNVISELQLLIKGLRAEKSELERLVEKLNEHLSATLSGRPNTRGNSVPRSPRLGACVSSPRPNTRVIGGCSLPNIPGGNHSRGSSPTSGDPGTGLRTATATAAFGEGTHGSMQQRAEKSNLKRFGNHLQ